MSLRLQLAPRHLPTLPVFGHLACNSTGPPALRAGRDDGFARFAVTRVQKIVRVSMRKHVGCALLETAGGRTAFICISFFCGRCTQVVEMQPGADAARGVFF
jgi:hypothetical protein